MRRGLSLLSSAVLVLALAVPAAPAAAQPAADPVTATIYLLADQPDGGPFLMPVHRDVPATLDLPAAAVQALLDGPTQAERDTIPTISTAVPADVELLVLTIDDGVATVDLDGTFDDGGGSASMFARLGQLVYTLTRFDGVDTVALSLDGEPVEVFSGEGLVLDGPIGRDWFTDQDAGVVPPVLLESPAWGASFPPYVAGSVLDDTDPLALGIWDGEGLLVGEAVVGYREPARFSEWLPFVLPASGLGSVVVDVPDGPGLREHLVRFGADPVRNTTLACPDVPHRDFSDVADTSAHVDAIACAVHWRILLGYADGTFGPTAAVTRAQAASALARLLIAAGIDLPAAPLVYTDVAADSPHADAIAQLTELGVVRGLDAGRFGPGQPVTRAQVATMLHRSLGLLDGASLMASEESFADDDASVHELAIATLAQLRLVGGTDRATFSPGAAVTRAQFAALVARTADLLVASGHATPPPNVFDVYEAEVGDEVVGLTIALLEVSEPTAPYLTAHVGFAGEVTVTGTVTAYDDHEHLGNAVCVGALDATSERALPRMLQDTRYQWFCFTNSDVAASEVFGTGTVTEATVVIDEFTIHHAPTEIWNTARLLRVDAS